MGLLEKNNINLQAKMVVLLMDIAVSRLFFYVPQKTLSAHGIVMSFILLRIKIFFGLNHLWGKQAAQGTITTVSFVKANRPT